MYYAESIALVSVILVVGTFLCFKKNKVLGWISIGAGIIIFLIMASPMVSCHAPCLSCMENLWYGIKGNCPTCYSLPTPVKSKIPCSDLNLEECKSRKECKPFYKIVKDCGCCEVSCEQVEEFIECRMKYSN